MRLLFLLILLSSNNQNCNYQGGGVQIIKATSQQWSGGAAGSGNGCNYTFYILTKNRKNIRTDSVWVNNYRLEAKVDKQSSKGDTVVIIATELHGGINKSPQNTLHPSALPKGTTGQAVLGYFVNGKRMYLPVKELKKLKDLNYE